MSAPKTLKPRPPSTRDGNFGAWTYLPRSTPSMSATASFTRPVGLLATDSIRAWRLAISLWSLGIGAGWVFPLLCPPPHARVRGLLLLPHRLLDPTLQPGDGPVHDIEAV